MEKWEVFSDRIFLNTKKEVWAIMQDKHTFAAVIPKQWETAEANTNLIVTMQNACISINKENPMAVAESIKDVYEELKYAYEHILSFLKDLEPNAMVEPESFFSPQDRERISNIEQALAKSQAK